MKPSTIHDLQAAAEVASIKVAVCLGAAVAVLVVVLLGVYP